MRTWTALLIGSFAMAVSASVSAHPGSRAAPRTDDELIADGIALRKQGQDAEALAAFERAYALRRSGRAMAQIALAQQALSHWREAEDGLLAALRQSGDRWVAFYRPKLEQSLAAVQAHLAWLDVESNVTAAELWVDGQLVGVLPIEGGARVVAGDLSVEVRAGGLPPIHRHMTVEAGAHTHAPFLFALPVAEAEAKPSTASPVLPALPSSPSPSRRAGFIALGAAAGLALVGAIGVVTREEEATIWNDDKTCGPLDGQTRADRCGTNRHIGVLAQTVGIAAFVGSGAALAVSGWLFWRGSRPTTSSSSGRLECRFAGTGVVCGKTF